MSLSKILSTKLLLKTVMLLCECIFISVNTLNRKRLLILKNSVIKAGRWSVKGAI